MMANVFFAAILCSAHNDISTSSSSLLSAHP